MIIIPAVFLLAVIWLAPITRLNLLCFVNINKLKATTKLVQPITFPADNVHGTVFQIDNKHSRTSATTFLRQRFLEAATTSRSRQTRSTEPLREQRTWHTTNRVSFTHTNSASSVFHGDAGATGQGVSFFCLTFRFVSLHSPFFLSFFFLSFFFVPSVLLFWYRTIAMDCNADFLYWDHHLLPTFELGLGFIFGAIVDGKRLLFFFFFFFL